MRACHELSAMRFHGHCAKKLKRRSVIRHLMIAMCASLLFFLRGENWRFGSVMMILATIALGSSLVVYDAILCRIASPTVPMSCLYTDKQRGRWRK